VECTAYDSDDNEYDLSALINTKGNWIIPGRLLTMMAVGCQRLADVPCLLPLHLQHLMSRLCQRLLTGKPQPTCLSSTSAEVLRSPLARRAPPLW
jgi:hypothetical protein